MRLFLLLNSYKPDDVHGVDYIKGLVDEEEKVLRECGRRHEFQTRQCHPVYLNEVEVRRMGYQEHEVVEIVPMHERTIDRMAKSREEEAA